MALRGRGLPILGSDHSKCSVTRYEACWPTSKKRYKNINVKSYNLIPESFDHMKSYVCPFENHITSIVFSILEAPNVSILYKYTISKKHSNIIAYLLSWPSILIRPNFHACMFNHVHICIRTCILKIHCMKCCKARVLALMSTKTKSFSKLRKGQTIQAKYLPKPWFHPPHCFHVLERIIMYGSLVSTTMPIHKFYGVSMRFQKISVDLVK